MSFHVHEQDTVQMCTRHLCLQNLHLNVHILGGCQGECFLSFLSYSAPVKEPVQKNIFCFCSECEEMSFLIPILENRIYLPNHKLA